MSKQPFDRDALQPEFQQLLPKYRQLEDALKRDLTTCLQKDGIEVLAFESRIKKFDSFWEKALRKHYDSPLDDTDDICGIRIICYYPSDVQPVCQVIEDELEVVESVDKADLQRPEEFGYQSRHLIVAPKEHWLKTPSYKGLDGLRAEIQIRTLFQHAWAELSHELSYKKEGQVPRQFLRKLHQLSAMLENLDYQFDDLHTQKADYGKAVLEEASRTGEFDLGQELNIDTLQAFLDFLMPNMRNDSLYQSPWLLERMQDLGISFSDVIIAFESTESAREQLAKASSAMWGSQEWSQEAMVNAALNLVNDEWWKFSRSGESIYQGSIEYSQLIQRLRETVT
jgi:ppGpp synthetase/RelA/SpoT-type nucleotidyltranferase